MAGDLWPWIMGTGVTLTSWEFELIITLSDELAACLKKFQGSTDRAPILGPAKEETIAEGVASVFAQISEGLS